MAKGGAIPKSRNRIRTAPRNRRFPKKPLRRLPALYQKLDGAMAEAGKKLEVTCTKGCADCCYQMVSMSLVEALAIIDHIYKKANRAVHFKSRSLPIIQEQSELFLKGSVTVRMWFELQVPCVFLTQDNLCSVYDVRPVACRTYAVVSDPKLCSPESGAAQKVGAVDNRKMIKHSLAVTWEIAKELGVLDTHAPMPVALMLAHKLFAGGVAEYQKAIQGSIFAAPAKAAEHWSKMEMREL